MHGCWGQCRLYNYRDVRRMAIGSQGSVWILHLWSAESNHGLIERTTPGSDHVCGLGVLQGQGKAHG